MYDPLSSPTPSLNSLLLPDALVLPPHSCLGYAIAHICAAAMDPLATTDIFGRDKTPNASPFHLAPAATDSGNDKAKDLTSASPAAAVAAVAGAAPDDVTRTCALLSGLTAPSPAETHAHLPLLQSPPVAWPGCAFDGDTLEPTAPQQQQQQQTQHQRSKQTHAPSASPDAAASSAPAKVSSAYFAFDSMADLAKFPPPASLHACVRMLSGQAGGEVVAAVAAAGRLALAQADNVEASSLATAVLRGVWGAASTWRGARSCYMF